MKAMTRRYIHGNEQPSTQEETTDELVTRLVQRPKPVRVYPDRPDPLAAARGCVVSALLGVGFSGFFVALYALMRWLH